MGKARQHANFKSGVNLHVDIDNNRVGVGTTIPSSALQVTGTITCIDINSTSDVRLKENIHSIDNALDKVNSISGITFDWIENKQSSAGVIAQEVEQILPEIVHENEGNKTVNYNGLIGLLVEAIKEQQDQINNLKARLDQLEG